MSTDADESGQATPEGIDQMPLAFSASTVKSWFQYRCERKTRYETMSGKARDAIPILRDTLAPWAKLGTDFERRVVERLMSDSAVLTPANGEEALSQALSLAFLRGESDALYAHQLVLDPRPPLRQRLHLADAVQIRRSFADLVRREPCPTLLFSLVEIKATQHSTPFHKAQVAFYSLLLESILIELNAGGRVADAAEIWTLQPGSSGSDGLYRVERFALAPYQRLVVDFFQHEVPSIATRRVEKGRDETFFHLYFKCEQCEYLRHCSRAIDPGMPPGQWDVSAVPGVSHEAKRALHSLGIHRVGQLAQASGLKSGNLTSNWALRRRAEVLEARAESLISGECRRITKVASYLMPPRVDMGLYLVVDVDPVENNLAALGLLRDDGRDPLFHIAVLESGAPEQEREALCAVMSSLIGALADVDAHNQAHENAPEAQIHAHIYLYEPTEGRSLQEAVARHLEDPRVRHGLLNLVRIFPPEDLVPEPEFRGIHHLPATSLRSVVEQLLGLPVTVSYDLRQVTTALAASDDTDSIRAYRPKGPFLRPFSSRLSIDVCRGLRLGRTAPAAVESDVKARLEATRDLAHWLMARNAEATAAADDRAFLRLNKRPFRFQTTFDPLQAADLDLLQAFELLENRAGLLASLVELAQPWRQRRDRGRCMARLKLRKWGRNQRNCWLSFAVPSDSRDSDLSASNMDLILTDDDPDLRLDPTRWDAYAVNIVESDQGFDPGMLLVSMGRETFDGDEFQRLMLSTDADGWFLDQTFKDFTTPRAAAFMAYLAADEEAAR